MNTVTDTCAGAENSSKATISLVPRLNPSTLVAKE